MTKVKEVPLSEDISEDNKDVTEAIKKLLARKEAFKKAQEEEEYYSRLTEANRIEYGKRLYDMIDKEVVKTDKVYVVDGKAVVFRKEYDSRSDSHHRYDYDMEVMEVST